MYTSCIFNHTNYKLNLLLLAVCAYLCLTVTPWAVALQTPPSMEFSRQEYWSRLPSPTPGDLPNAGIEPASLESPALASSKPPGKPQM